jgi:VWFA-related protein
MGSLDVTGHRLVRLCCLILVLAAGVLVIVPHAQDATSQQPPPQQPTFRAGIDSVSVDVVVTDRQGKPVRDLTKADFTIEENGKLQTIETFKFVTIDESIDSQLEDREILSFADQRTEVAREENRLLVIFLDDYHVRRGTGMAVRNRLAEFVSQLTPHDLVAVVTPVSIMGALTFSRSHITTASAIRAFEGRKYDYTVRNAIEARLDHLPPEEQERFRNDMVIAALRNLSQQLGTMREGRKTILYFSEGMTGSMPAGVRTTGSQYGSRPGGAPDAPNQSSREVFDTAALVNQMQQVFEAANGNDVAIYTVDPRGLAIFEYGVNEDVNMANDRRILTEATDNLRTIAGNTNGRAIINANDFMPGLKQMMVDGATYYLLGYTSTLAARDGKFHPITVRVKRSGVDVRARKGYWAYSAEEAARASAPPKPAAPEEVTTALSDLVAVADGRGTHAVLNWLGAVRGSGEKARVTYAWEPAATGSVDPIDRVDHVTIVANAVTGDEVYRATIAKDPARNGGQATFETPPGAVRVRITAENANNQRIDTDMVSLEVPDFTGTGPILATPFIYRGRTAREIQQIRAGATAGAAVVKRVFSRTDRLLLRVGAYGPGGTAPTLTLRLVNANGSTIATLPAPTVSTTDPNLFESELIFGSFPPGDYVLELSAEVTGQTTKQVLGLRLTS